jgi:hypothetical protein
MWRIAAFAVLLCAGCADCHTGCLWQDSFLGDVARCVPWERLHKNACADGTCQAPAPVTIIQAQAPMSNHP